MYGNDSCVSGQFLLSAVFDMTTSKRRVAIFSESLYKYMYVHVICLVPGPT